MLVRRSHRLALAPWVLFTSLLEGSPPGPNEAEDPVVQRLAHLDRYVAEWLVREHHFNARGEQIATVNGREEIIWILGKRAIRRTYTTSTDSTNYQAIGTLTWNDVTKKYQGIWVDNVSTTGPTKVESDWNEGDQTMVYTVDSLAEDGSTVRHRVIERFVDDEHREAATYLLKGDDVIKQLELHYKRAIPCPGKRMRLIDELNP